MPHPKRPLPPDFAELAPRMTCPELVAYYRCNDRVLRRWMAESGVSSRGMNRRAWPDNLQEIAKGKSLTDIAAAIGWARNTLSDRLKSEWPELHAAAVAIGTKQRAVEVQERRPPPVDFADMAASMSASQLCVHYRAAFRVVSRWIDAHPGLREIVTANGHRNSTIAAKVHAQQTRRQRGFHLKPLTKDNVQRAVVSDADKAMVYLRRFGPCYPRSVYGPQYGGYTFALCPHVMSADEIIAEAKRRGWNPDAWRELAA